MNGKGDMHLKCIKSLFGTNAIPNISFTLEEVSLEVQKTVGKISISGIQPKLSVRVTNPKNEISVVTKNGQMILKPQTNTYPSLPENENACMTVFTIFGIDSAPHSIMKLKDNSNAYIVKRFDRRRNKKLHFEDFQSVLNLDDKYSGSVEAIGKGLKKYAKFPGLDIQKFFKGVVCNFIVGNGDAHLKNYGLLYDKTGSMSLSPFYDIVCSKLVIPDEEDSAIPLSGKKNRLKKKDFSALANYLDMNNNEITMIFNEILNAEDNVLDFIANYHLLDTPKRDKMLEIFKSGFDVIKSE